MKGFARTRLLAPGEAQTLRFRLDADSLASFHDDRRAWLVEPGTHRVRIGASSRDIRGEAGFAVDEEIVTREVIAELSPEFDLKEMSP